MEVITFDGEMYQEQVAVIADYSLSQVGPKELYLLLRLSFFNGYIC